MEECGHKENHSNGMDNGEFKVAVSTTLHCLTGCAVGEILGLIIGVGLGLSVVGIVVLATTLAYVSGFTLGLLPLVRRKMTLRRALKMIWVGEVISIAVMELAMNVVDFYAGGMTAGSVFSLQFWFGMVVALPAGFLAALPVNYIMIKKNIKKCH